MSVLRQAAPAAAWALLLGAVTVVPGAAQERPPAGELDRFLAECGDAEGVAEHAEEGEESRFSDRCNPLAELPARPRGLLELGEPFLSTGTLGDGFTLPTGAVWQPALIAFGTLRTAFQGGRIAAFDDPLVEAVARFDLFGNLYLTQTERVVVGLRPLDQGGSFTGLTISSPDAEAIPEEFRTEFNGSLDALFFEGDLAEVFPGLDSDDSGGDLYLSVGRQALAFQDGMLLDESSLDMLGLSKANLKLGGTVNTRIAAVWGWGALDRPMPGGNRPDGEASLFGLFTEIDTRSTTLNLDAAYVMAPDSTGDGLYLGVSDIRRIGRFNNTFRVLASLPVGEETFANRRGVLVHNQFGWTPHHSHDFWYVSTFVGIESFRSAVRGPSNGGPLGQTGVLFAAPGIGRVGAPLGGQADEAAGGAIGRQLFFDDTRQQLVVEVGGRARYRREDGAAALPGEDVLGALFRWQAAMGRRFVFVLDGIGRHDLTSADTDLFGRIELVLKL